MENYNSTYGLCSRPAGSGEVARTSATCKDRPSGEVEGTPATCEDGPSKEVARTPVTFEDVTGVRWILVNFPAAILL